MCKLLVFLSRNNHCYQCISYRSRDTHSIFMCRHRYLYRYTMEREKAIDTDNFFFFIKSYYIHWSVLLKMFRKGLVINQKTIKRLSLMNPCRFSLSLRAVKAPLGVWDPFKKTPAKGHLGCFIRFALSVLAPTCCSFPSLISVKSLVSL